MTLLRPCLMAAAGIALTINVVSAIDLSPARMVIRTTEGAFIRTIDSSAALRAALATASSTVLSVHAGL